MTTDQITRYRAKAAIAAMAWQQTLGEAPTVHALILALWKHDAPLRLHLAEALDLNGKKRGRRFGECHQVLMQPAACPCWISSHYDGTAKRPDCVLLSILKTGVLPNRPPWPRNTDSLPPQDRARP